MKRILIREYKPPLEVDTQDPYSKLWHVDAICDINDEIVHAMKSIIHRHQLLKCTICGAEEFKWKDDCNTIVCPKGHFIKFYGGLVDGPKGNLLIIPYKFQGKEKRFTRFKKWLKK